MRIPVSSCCVAPLDLGALLVSQSIGRTAAAQAADRSTLAATERSIVRAVDSRVHWLVELVEARVAWGRLGFSCRADPCRRSCRRRGVASDSSFTSLREVASSSEAQGLL